MKLLLMYMDLTIRLPLSTFINNYYSAYLLTVTVLNCSMCVWLRVFVRISFTEDVWQLVHATLWDLWKYALR